MSKTGEGLPSPTVDVIAAQVATGFAAARFSSDLPTLTFSLSNGTVAPGSDQFPIEISLADVPPEVRGSGLAAVFADVRALRIESFGQAMAPAMQTAIALQTTPFFASGPGAQQLQKAQAAVVAANKGANGMRSAARARRQRRGQRRKRRSK